MFTFLQVRLRQRVDRLHDRAARVLTNLHVALIKRPFQGETPCGDDGGANDGGANGGDGGDGGGNDGGGGDGGGNDGGGNDGGGSDGGGGDGGGSDGGGGVGDIDGDSDDDSDGDSDDDVGDGDVETVNHSDSSVSTSQAAAHPSTAGLQPNRPLAVKSMSVSEMKRRMDGLVRSGIRSLQEASASSKGQFQFMLVGYSPLLGKVTSASDPCLDLCTFSICTRSLDCHFQSPN